MTNLLRRLFLRVFGTLMPRTAARWVGRHMTKPYPVPAMGSKPKAAVTKTRIPYAHGWLAVSTWGEGPTVVLLHGWGSRASNFGAFVDPLVNAGFRVVAYDAPAHGDSDGERTSLIECSGAALQVGRLFGPLAGVVGHSFGAPSVALASKHGLTFERAVFLGAPLSVMELMMEAGESLGVPQRVCELMLSEFEQQFRFKRDELDTDHLVEELDVPLLVIHDESDKVAPVEDGVAIAAAAPDCELVRTNGLGHRGALTDSDVIARSIEFIAAGVRSQEAKVSV